MKTHEESIEVLNSGFLKIFRKIDSLREPSLLEGWMKRIFIHTALSALRKKRFDTSTLEPETHGQEFAHSNTGEENLELEHLHSLIRALPDNMRTVFNLYVIEGYSHKEISKEMNIPVGTSKYLLSEARQRLRHSITQNDLVHG